MRYQLAVFDLDGTILDTLQDLYLSVNYALQKNHLPERTLSEIQQFVGNGIRKLIERSVPADLSDPEKINQVYEDFTGYYTQHYADHTMPYEQIIEVIQTIRHAGLLTAVVSNKADYAVQSLCETYFPALFDSVAGEKAGIPRKPAPDSVLSVLTALQCSPEQAVYIGDSEIDIETAKNAGLSCISVTWGFRSEAFLKEHHAGILISTPAELIPLLCE
ncbi:MAG: HAD family hydrolase [Oscillospiraceae bacterium]|nr:HAD family hydrolase [Oscillospiraceae bacterium]